MKRLERFPPAAPARFIRPGTTGNAVLLLLAGFALGILVMVWTRPGTPRPVSPGRPTDVRVLLSDRFLARQVAHNVGHLGISQVTVRSAPPSVLVARGRWNSPLGLVPIEVVAEPVASRGTLHLVVLSAQLAGVSIPPSIAQAIANSEAGSLKRPLGANARIRSVRVVRQGVRLSADYVSP